MNEVIPWCKRHRTHHVLYRIGGRVRVPAWLYEAMPLWLLRAADRLELQLIMWGWYQ